MHFLRYSLSLIALSIPGKTRAGTINARDLPSLNAVSRASSRLLIGTNHHMNLQNSARRRWLRPTIPGNETVPHPMAYLDGQTVLVSYRYLTENVGIDESSTDDQISASLMRHSSPFRLLRHVQKELNNTKEAPGPDTDGHQANVVARNMVLARLFFNLIDDPKGRSSMQGMQSTMLPFDCSYLPALHMEVLKAPESLDRDAIRALLLADPYVENVWLDELINGAEGHTLEGTQRGRSKPGFGQISRNQSDPIQILPPIQIPNENWNAADEFDPIIRGAGRPNDVHFNQQWAHVHPRFGVHSSDAWDSWTGENTSFVVALVDSGVDIDHEDLRPQLWRNSGETDCFNGIDDDGNGYIDDCMGWDWIDNDNLPQDENGHGTASAGIIAGVTNNHAGISGVCWGCRLMILRTLDKDIRGTISGFIKAIDYALVHGAKISNNSYGGRGSSFASLQTAVRRARKQGMIFVAAAGNYGSDNDIRSLQPTYPASYDDTNIISVAAIDQRGQLASFSCYGRQTVDIAAPGVGIYSTGLNNGYVRLDGTSFATPFVTGAAALIWSKYPELSADEVIERMLQNASPLASLTDKVSSGGALNIAAALMNRSNSTHSLRSTRPAAVEQSVTCDLAPHACPMNSLCIDTDAGFRCRCVPGFQHQNGECDPKPYSCEQLECPLNSSCETVGLQVPQCVCDPGYHMPETSPVCTDVNECILDPHICPRDSTCVNTQGAFDCKCRLGHRWNGLAWIQKGAECVEVRTI